MIRLLLHMLRAVGHRHAKACEAQHIHIVFRVAKGDNLLRQYVEPGGRFPKGRPFSAPFAGNLQAVGRGRRHVQAADLIQLFYPFRLVKRPLADDVHRVQLSLMPANERKDIFHRRPGPLQVGNCPGRRPVFLRILQKTPSRIGLSVPEYLHRRLRLLLQKSKKRLHLLLLHRAGETALSAFHVIGSRPVGGDRAGQSLYPHHILRQG